MRTLFPFSARFLGILWFLSIVSLLGVSVASVAADAVTPQIIHGYISHADPAKVNHDPQAKIALGTAEHLAPSMPFANQRGLAHRAVTAKVRGSHEKPKILHGLLWLLMEVLFIAISILEAFVILVVTRLRGAY